MSNIKKFSSRKEVTEFLATKGIDTSNWSEEKWLQLNKGQAEIHMMALAEAMWDAMNESTPKELKAGEWHIPFEDKMTDTSILRNNMFGGTSEELLNTKIKISVAMCARTSYTVVGDEKEFTYEKQIELHDRMANQVPFHASPFEHCARAMALNEYVNYHKGKIECTDLEDLEFSQMGWCRNFKGFIQYREILENGFKG